MLFLHFMNIEHFVIIALAVQSSESVDQLRCFNDARIVSIDCMESFSDLFDVRVINKFDVN